MKARGFKMLYMVSLSVILLASLGLPVLHLLDIGTPDILVVLAGLCELVAAPVLVYSSMKLWTRKKEEDSVHLKSAQ